MYDFDLYRIFFGIGPHWYLLEVLFRTVFMFLYTLANVRLTGKRSIGQLSSFEFIIVIALGSAVGDPMFLQVPLIHAMLVITTVVGLEKIIAKWCDKNQKFENLISGLPALLIKDGNILKDTLKREGITIEDLLHMLRSKGIKDVGEVEYAFLERSGQLSVLKLPAGQVRSVKKTINNFH